MWQYSINHTLKLQLGEGLSGWVSLSTKAATFKMIKPLLISCNTCSFSKDLLNLPHSFTQSITSFLTKFNVALLTYFHLKMLQGTSEHKAQTDQRFADEEDAAKQLQSWSAHISQYLQAMPTFFVMSGNYQCSKQLKGWILFEKTS